MLVSSISFCSTKAQYLYKKPRQQKGGKFLAKKTPPETTGKIPNRLLTSLVALSAVLNYAVTQTGNSDIPETTDGKEPSSSHAFEELPSDKVVEELEIPEQVEDVVNEIKIPDMSDWSSKINLSEEQKYSVKKFIQNWEKNSDRYYYVEEETGIPAPIVAAIHWRESSGNFNKYLHNGAELGITINTYLGERYFTNWEDSAIDALLNYAQPEGITDDVQTWLEFMERYNGTGYRKYYGISSPYVYAGTTLYASGKYTSDGKFDPSVVDQQPGTVVLLASLQLYSQGKSYEECFCG